MSPYIYSDLSNEHHIRIMTLKPSLDPKTPLKCDLFESSLDESDRHFEGVSYCCGDQLPSIELQVEHNDNNSLMITEHLASALRQFRRQHEPRNLWVDAICIHQSDLTEKAQQVAMMGHIYSKASSTLAWLGQTGPDLQRAGKIGEAIAQEMRLEEYYTKTAAAGEMARRIKAMDVPDADMIALLSVFRVPYFERRWVVQEIVLPRDVYFHCGEESLHWPVLERIGLILMCVAAEANTEGWRMELFQPPTSALRTSVVLNSRVMRQSYREQMRESLLSSLLMCKDWKCLDARDLVYALLGLSPSSTLEFTVNYEETTEEVFRRLAIVHLKAGDLGILHHVNNEGSDSFVPDWRRHLNGLRLGGPGASAFRAGSKAGRPIANAQVTVNDAGKPCIATYKFQTVEQIIPYHNGPDEFFAWLWGIRCAALFVGHSSSMRSAARTLIAAGRPPNFRRMALDVDENLGDCLAVIVDTAMALKVNFGLCFPGLINQLDEELRNKAQDEQVTPAEVNALTLWRGMTMTLWERALFITDSGYTGIGPARMCEGDEVHIVLGAETPFFLRATAFEGDQNYRELIGECFLYGFMDGECFDDTEDPASIMKMVPLL